MTSKYRFWGFIYYPEFFPVDILDSELKNLHVDFLHSPLHYSDNEEKKEHFHYVLCWSGPTTSDHINFNVLGSIQHDCKKNITFAFPLFQVNGYIRYLIHADDPNKQQFKNGDKSIFVYGKDANNQLKEAFTIGDYDAVQITKDICEFIVANDIKEFPDLIEICNNSFPKWAYLLYKRVPDSVKLCLNSQRYRR